MIMRGICRYRLQDRYVMPFYILWLSTSRAFLSLFLVRCAETLVMYRIGAGIDDAGGEGVQAFATCINVYALTCSMSLGLF